MSYPDLAMPPEITTALFSDYSSFDDLPYAEVIEQVIREVARSGNAVIVGRGGAYILKNEPNTLHVHVFAPFAQRARAIQATEGLDQAAAERLVQETDPRGRATSSTISRPTGRRSATTTCWSTRGRQRCRCRSHRAGCW